MDTMFCTASMTSQTFALKAQKALADSVIPSRVVKLDGEKSRRGCSYGIEFACHQLNNVKMILQKNRIKAKHFYSGDIEI